MVKHILIGVDGSKESLEAARYGQGLAEQLNGQVTFVFVFEPPQMIAVGPLSGYLMTSAQRSAEDVKQVRKMLDDIIAERPNVPTVARVEFGKASETLCDVASQLGVDLIIVGSRGLGAGSRLFLGSVSDRIVHHASCGVLVLRPRNK